MTSSSPGMHPFEVIDLSTPSGSARPSLPAPPIQASDLVKRFGAQPVLDGVSLEVADGEMLVVLGPSGSGKTTLLRILAGLERPDAGEVWLRGMDATPLPPQRRGFGIVFQEQALFARMTAEQNVAFGLELRGVTRSDLAGRVEEMVRLVRLEKHRTKYPHQLSGGQRQRVALARALAFGPDALLFDEPFNAVDVVTRTELRREVRSLLRAANLPALFITHDQEEALELGDRIAVLNAGVIEQIGTPFEVYNRPQTEFVATFLGAANVLLGRWRDGRVQLGALRLKPPTEVPELQERQAVKLVFRPEDVVLNFQAQLLGTPHYMGSAVVEDVSYAGAAERLVVRLTFRARGGHDTAPRVNDPGSEGEAYAGGFPITVSRTKWDATEMELSPGDPVEVGLKDYRLLAHYPLRIEPGAKLLA